MQLYAFDPETRRAWTFHASEAWFRRHDNGVAAAIGFRVPGEVSERQLKRLGAKSVSWEKWSHSGCTTPCGATCPRARRTHAGASHPRSA